MISQLLAPFTGDLDAMVRRRYVRMLVTFSKTNYFIDRGQQRGATYDAGKLLEQFLNDRLRATLPPSPAGAAAKNIQLHVVFLPVSRDRIFQDLAQGKGDIAAANLTITPDRQKIADFARPLLTDVREVVVSAADQPPIARLEDLSGREVHVRKSSSYFGSLTRLNATLRAGRHAPVKIVESPEELEDEDLLEMANAGLVPATVVDDHIADFWRQVYDHIRVEPVTVSSGGEIAWAVRKNASQLHDAVDAFVQANAKGSKNFNIIYQRYLKNTGYVKNAASESEMRKFQQIRTLFQKYGDQYDMPWLLLAAQGYQESQLDQGRKSSAGAVGVMQIKPSTAAGPPINVTGVDDSAEKNIQAGAKYLRFIMDEYYKDEPMDRLNKMLFAFAAYNAGPARVRQLRKEAEKRGLDPNVWFGNVEQIASERIGRETVTYVSNIYKYYIAYKLITEEHARRQASKAKFKSGEK